MKQERQQTLVDIVTSNVIETQEELLEFLSARGYSATQATVSRDMKELSLGKTLVDGKYRYAVLAQEKSALSQIYKEGILSVVAAQNIVVVKTKAGLAMAVCTELDNMEITGNVGTLAGDDTCLLIMKDNDSATDFVTEMEGFLGL